MEIKDYISAISLLMIIFNVYWNILRGPKYLSPPLRWIVFGLLPENDTLVINFPIAVTNVGSLTGVIDSFYIEFINLSNRKIERFYAWQEGKLLGENFKGFSPDMPTPVSLKAGESIVKHYTFFPDSPTLICTRGTYKIYVYAYLSGKKKPVKLSEQKLEIEDVLEPSPITNMIPLIFSYNLCPKQILKVSTYGNHTSSGSIIKIVKS